MDSIRDDCRWIIKEEQQRQLFSLWKATLCRVQFLAKCFKTIANNFVIKNKQNQLRSITKSFITITISAANGIPLVWNIKTPRTDFTPLKNIRFLNSDEIRNTPSHSIFEVSSTCQHKRLTPTHNSHRYSGQQCWWRSFQFVQLMIRAEMIKAHAVYVYDRSWRIGIKRETRVGKCTWCRHHAIEARVLFIRLQQNSLRQRWQAAKPEDLHDAEVNRHPELCDARYLG